MMAAGRLSSQDRKDLERFTKFLIYKTLQIVVQSRLGEKIKTQSKSISSGSDWFNIAIKDNPDVQNETKKLLGTQTFSTGQTICLEICLKTADSDVLQLEVWHVSMSEECDVSMRTAHTAYYRMSMALKSVFSVSRVTPAYKLSRQQTMDNYIVCYKMFLGEPKIYHLGAGYKTVKVASVPMVMGTIKIYASYRTKLQISPQSSNCYKCFDVKADHFLIDKRVSQKKALNEFIRNLSNIPKTAEVNGNPTRHDAVESTAEKESMHNLTGEVCMAENDVDMVNGQTMGLQFVSSQPITIAKQLYEARPNDFMPNSTANTSSPIHQHKTSAFAKQHTLTQYSMDLDDIPFESLLQRNYDDSRLRNTLVLKDNENCHKIDTVTQKCSEDMERSSTKNCLSHNGDACIEDFVMLDLKTPFAATDSGSELNQFYRECQTAPMLSMFTTEPDVDVALSTITQQLHIFETSMKDFDNFVSTLQDSD